MVASIVGGFLTVVALYSVNWFRTGTIEPINPPGFFLIGWCVVVSFLAGIVGSLLSGPPPEDSVNHYFKVPREESPGDDPA
jgi:Na+/proline symporter